MIPIKYKRYIWPILAGVTFFILYSWIVGIFSGEKGRVRKFILQGRQAVESQNIFTCANMISTDYRDKYGNDRQGLIYIAKEAFGYYKTISVRIDNMNIELDDSGRQAEVEIKALIIGQGQQDNKEKILEAEKGEFRVKLIKENNK
ncbi:MAG: hypothetical protein ABIH75_00550, partial [Candidatus Omnitrophota bacterium]